MTKSENSYVFLLLLFTWFRGLLAPPTWGLGRLLSGALHRPLRAAARCLPLTSWGRGQTWTGTSAALHPLPPFFARNKKGRCHRVWSQGLNNKKKKPNPLWINQNFFTCYLTEQKQCSTNLDENNFCFKDTSIYIDRPFPIFLQRTGIHHLRPPVGPRASHPAPRGRTDRMLRNRPCAIRSLSLEVVLKMNSSKYTVVNPELFPESGIICFGSGSRQNLKKKTEINMSIPYCLIIQKIKCNVHLKWYRYQLVEEKAFSSNLLTDLDRFQDPELVKK